MRKEIYSLIRPTVTVLLLIAGVLVYQPYADARTCKRAGTRCGTSFPVTQTRIMHRKHKVKKPLRRWIEPTCTLRKSDMMQNTFAMIKPDAVSKKYSGKIIDMVEQNGFDIVRMHKVRLTKEGAHQLYAIHKDRPFFNEMVDFITSGPLIIMVLAKDNAIQAWRDLLGATDPSKAAPGTIRSMFGSSIGNNAAHGSDSPENAAQELKLFFPDLK